MIKQKDIYTIAIALGIIIPAGLCFLLGAWVYFSLRPEAEEAQASWSPDSQQLVFVCYRDGPTDTIAENLKRHYTEEAADICTINRDGRNLRQLTQDVGQIHYPKWSPDGSQIAYTRPDGIYVINIQGGNERRLVQVSPNKDTEEMNQVHWSPDGTQLLFSACLEENDLDVYLMDVETGKLTNLTSTSPLQDIEPHWTLDGTKIIFSSTTSSLFPYSCSLEYDAPLQLKVMNANGSEEEVIYDEGNFYGLVSVSNNGTVVFVSDLSSKTNWESGTSGRDSYLYTLSLDQRIPVQRAKGSSLASYSPDEKYLLNGKILLNLETGEEKRLPEMPFVESIDSWSPDQQEVTLTVSEDGGTGFYSELHIYIFNLREGTVRSLIPK